MSLSAIFTNIYLRYRFKPVPGAAIDVAKAREKIARMLRYQGKLPADIQYLPVAAHAGLCGAAWFQPAHSERTILYFHGGGYFFCSIESHQSVCAYLSRVAQARVCSVDYRLAPEHAYPAAVDDALAWYQELLKTTPANKIIVAGDSAGGGLALACLLAARKVGLAMPAAAVLFSPWVDLACEGASMQTQAQADVMFTPDSLPKAAALYLQGTPAKTELASPLYADLRGMPPLQIFASRHEILLDDATRLHQHAQAAGVSSELILASRLPHVWPTMVNLPEARASLRQAADFIRQNSL
ncbi:alpha/beta hydrolase [Undibacterium sp. Di27W]|uniref:alpha/beta hydrolase n=1 Tax=Undibacterium sp. Di27W TaxID=3413036 RepID=UPI003BF3DB3B